jgi:hypothetical protein
MFSDLESQWNKKLTDFKEGILEQKSLGTLEDYLLMVAKNRLAESNDDQESKPTEMSTGEAMIGEVSLLAEIHDSDWLETEISRSKIFEGGATDRPSKEALELLKIQIVTTELYSKAVSQLLNLKKRDLEADWLKNSAQPIASLVFEDVRSFLHEDILNFVDEIQRTHGPIKLSGDLSSIPEPSDVVFDPSRLSPEDARAFRFNYQSGSYLGVHQEWGLANDDVFKQVVARKTSEAAQLRAVNTVNYINLKLTQFRFARSNQIQRLNFELVGDSRMSELRMCLREKIMKGDW